MRAQLERLVLVGVLSAMAGLGIWMQVNLLEPAENKVAAPLTNEPDYYIQNFTATGRDEAGVIYVLKAERLAHFPIDNTALLDKPHLGDKFSMIPNGFLLNNKRFASLVILLGFNKQSLMHRFW